MKPRRALSGLFRRRAQNGPWNDGSFRVAKPRLFLSDRLTKLVENTYLYRAYRTRVRSNLVVFRRPEFHIWHSVKDVRRSWKRLHAILLSTFYYPHIIVRYLHDHLYHKSKKYRRYHDHPATETVHRAALAGFVASFLIFTALQYGVPGLFDIFSSNQIAAATTSKIWSTISDFTTGQTPNVTNTNLSISNNTGDDGDGSIRLGQTAAVGTGADGALIVDGTTAANNTLNGVLIAGGPFNSSNPLVLDTAIVRTNRIYNFTNVTLQNNAVITHSLGAGLGTGYEGIEIRATGSVIINTGSSIDVSGKGNKDSGAVNGGGGGHAGSGGASAGVGGSAYAGNDINAEYLGSVGANSSSGSTGGKGGGRVKINASVLTVAGTIQANGLGGISTGSDAAAGGGSGGSIAINTGTLNANNYISAAGGGGGGHSAIASKGGDGLNGIGGAGISSINNSGGPGGQIGLFGNGGAGKHAADGIGGGYSAGGGGTSPYVGYGGGGGGSGSVKINYSVLNGNSTPKSYVVFQETSSDITYTGTWSDIVSGTDNLKQSATTGNTAVYNFSGDAIQLFATKKGDGGKANIYVDNVLQGTIDLYGGSYTNWDMECVGWNGYAPECNLGTAYYTYSQQNVFEKTGLGEGNHQIKVEVTGTKNAASQGYAVNVDYFKSKTLLDGRYSDSEDVASMKVGPFANWTKTYTYNALGNLGTSGVGLRFDNLAVKSKWNSIRVMGNVPSGTTVKFQVRAGSTLGANDPSGTNGFADPTSYTAINTWSSTIPAGDYTTQCVVYNLGWGTPTTNCGGQYGAFINIDSNMPLSKTFEIIMQLGGGEVTPRIDSIQLSYDSLEIPQNGNIQLYRSDATTKLKSSSGVEINAGISGGHTNETSLSVVASNLTCTNCSGITTGRKIQVQYKKTESGAFDSDEVTNLVNGTSGDGDSVTSTAVITGLENGKSYQLRIRGMDGAGRVSDWLYYGSGVNTASESDINIEQTAPAGTVSINAGATYATSTNVILTNTATDTGGSNLSQMRFSNDGTTWSDWETYSTTKAWTLATGDGTKNVYAQYRDNAGNQSGTWLQTSQADFQGGTSTGNVYKDDSSGLIKLVPGTQTVTLRPNGVGLYAQNGKYPNIGQNWEKVDEEINDPLDYVSSADGTYKDLYNVQDTNLTTESITSVKIYGAGQGNDNCGGGTAYFGFGFYDGGGEYFATGSDVAFSSLPSPAIYTVNPRTSLPWTISQINALQIGFNSVNTCAGITVTQMYAEVSYTPIIASGEFISSSKDNLASSNYGAINWSANIPSGSGANALRFQIASNNDNSNWNFIGPDGTAITYYTASNTQLNTSHNGHRYIKYKVYFQTADSNYTPIVYDISVAVNTTSSDTVTLDTAPPVAVSGLKAYTDNTKTTQITDNTKWYTYTNPYFEWSANTDADLKEYKYCFETSPSCVPATTTNLVTNYTADLAAAADGAKSFRVVAVDNAGNPSTPVSIAYNFDKTLPGSVTGFTASSNDLTKITLSWNAFIAGQGAPLDSYKLERVKNSEYEVNLWDMSSDWSTGAGYSVFVLTTSGYTDDSSRIPDPVNPDPNLRQPAIETSVKYIYRITVKDQSNTQYSTPVTATGLTRDGRAPDDITGVKSSACDGTTAVITGTSVPRCSDVANKGFEIALTWNVTTDVGTGVSKYYIYRATSAPDVLASFTKIAETPAATSLYYDNDANNTANLTTPLNDFSTYYYRVTAIDNVGNESGLLPILDPTQNSTSATTPDVTAPTIPADVVATPMGLDGSDPTTPGGHQRVQITWSASSDIKARSTAAGSGVAGYKVYRADAEVGPYIDITTATGVTCDLTNRICTNDGLTGFTNYYYQILAFDNAVPTVNSSGLSLVVQVKTASDDVPGVPTGVTVNSIKGDPAQDARIGHNITMNFVGSSDKVYQITNYEVYRSTTNYSSAADWLDPAKATRLKLSLDLGCGTKCYISDANGSDISVTPIQDDRNSTYTIKDSGLTDATTYYYKVRAKDNTPAVPDGGPFYSGLSAISVGTPTVGWDITPDVTAPIIPVGGLEVKVRDTHPNEFELRNIVTWKMLTAEQLPMRNGASDFARYEIHREVIDPNTGAIVSDTNVGNVSTLGNNYLIDIIPIAFADLKYRYYVMVVDDAATNFKYSSGAVINTYSNNSAKEYWTDSIVPSKVRPVLSGAVTLTSVGVSSAVVNWTTDQEADSLVQFRVKGSSDNWIAIGQVERSINHQVNLFGLKPTTQYEYQLVSRNYLGNNVEYDASVLPPLTTSGFTITPGAVTTTTSTTEIAWETNLDASSAFVEYQLQRQPGDEPQGGTAGVDPSILSESPRNHKVVLKGLRSARTYTYKIKSISKDGFLSEYPGSEFANFKTRSFDSAQFTLAPASSNVAERNITATTAQIVWQTENPTTSWVDYSTSSGTYDNASGNNDMVNTHVVVIEGLVPGTTYYYRVRVKDANEVEYTSQEYSFTAVLKPKLSNMTVKQVTPYSVTIAWDTNVDTETVINWGKTAAYGEKRGKSGTSKVHEITVDNLDDNQEYHYQILAKDSAGNEVADTDKVVRTPLDTVGPKISNVKVDILPMGENETTASVIISWQTDKPATTLVEYDVGIVGGDYNNRSVEDTSLSNSHTVIVKGLSPASSYRYRIISKDKRSNSTTSQDYTFVTPTKEKSILQLILKSLEETFAWTRNLDQFFSNIGKRLTGRSS